MLLQALCIISQPSVNSNSSYSPETPNLGQNRRLLVPRDLEMWQITLKNNRAPLLCYFKLRVSFHNHRLFPEMPNLGQNRRFCVPCDLVIWRMALKHNRAPLLCYFKLCASFHNHRLIQTRVTYSPKTAKLGFDLCDLNLWPLTLTFCMDITFVNGNNSWKFHNDTIRGA